MTYREELGRLVRETWLSWAEEQPDPKPSWLLPWEMLTPAEQEVDMRIGEAVAAHVRANPPSNPVVNHEQYVAEHG